MNSVKVDVSEIRNLKLFLEDLIVLIDTQNEEFKKHLNVFGNHLSPDLFQNLSGTMLKTIIKPLAKFNSGFPPFLKYLRDIEASLIPYFDYYQLSNTEARVINIEALRSLSKKCNELNMALQSYHRNM